MDDAGLQLLRSIEAHMKELVGEVRRQNDATDELADRRAKGAAREAKRRAKMRQADATHDAIVTPRPEVVKDLSTKSFKDPERDATKRHAEPTDHRQLVEYGTAAIEKATGSKYPFEKQDAKHAENILKNHTLLVAKRVVDLACERFRREPFHAARGLSFKLVYAEAAQLLTARPMPANSILAAEEAGKQKAAEAAKREITRTLKRNADLQAIKGTEPPPEIRAMTAKIGNGKC